MYDLTIAATPIGNYEDITLRAVNVFHNIDFVVCEHEKEYRKLFGILEIPLKECIVCGKKNENEAVELVLEILAEKKKGVLISDCGTPLFEDPGYHLIQAVRRNAYSIGSLPGANSLMTALTLCPFLIRDFYFAGFLPQQKHLREKSMQSLLKRKETVIFLETPYRLLNILELLKKNAGNKRIFIPYNLTMVDEKLFWGNAAQVEKMIKKNNITKGEFMIVVESSNR